MGERWGWVTLWVRGGEVLHHGLDMGGYTMGEGWGGVASWVRDRDGLHYG